MAEYAIGNIVKGQVTGIEKYGIFVSLEDNYSGLIHISEVSNDFVKDINEYIKIGETIYCEILDVDKVNNKLKLSIKNINYKETIDDNNIKESRLGFFPLKNNLDRWIKDKISEIEKRESN